MLARALVAALLLALVPSASAGPLLDAAEEAEAALCALPDDTRIVCAAGAVVVLVVRIPDGVLEAPPEETARALVCSPIGRQACLAMSGDPGLGPWRPCTAQRSPDQSLLGATLWHAMHGGNMTLDGHVVTFPLGLDPAMGALTATHLAGTPLEGERPCADHWRTFASLVP